MSNAWFHIRLLHMSNAWFHIRLLYMSNAWLHIRRILESNEHTHNWKQLNSQVFCVRLASFSEEGFINEPHKLLFQTSGPEVIKLFSCSTQLSMKFVLLINIVGIFIFISREIFMLIWVEHGKFFITSGAGIGSMMIKDQTIKNTLIVK